MLVAACRERCGTTGVVGVCFDSHALKGAKALELAALLEPNPWQDVSTSMEALRLVKSDAEIGLIRKAARFADAALARAVEMAQPGITETQLAGHIDSAMRSLGGDYPAMPAWVSSGPSPSSPRSK